MKYIAYGIMGAIIGAIMGLVIPGISLATAPGGFLAGLWMAHNQSKSESKQKQSQDSEETPHTQCKKCSRSVDLEWAKGHGGICYDCWKASGLP